MVAVAKHKPVFTGKAQDLRGRVAESAVSGGVSSNGEIRLSIPESRFGPAYSVEGKVSEPSGVSLVRRESFGGRSIVDCGEDVARFALELTAERHSSTVLHSCRHAIETALKNPNTIKVERVRGGYYDVTIPTVGGSATFSGISEYGIGEATVVVLGGLNAGSTKGHAVAREGKALLEAAEAHFQLKKSEFDALVSSPESAAQHFAKPFRESPLPVFKVNPRTNDGDRASAMIDRARSNEYLNVTGVDLAIRTMDFRGRIDGASIEVRSWPNRSSGQADASVVIEKDGFRKTFDGAEAVQLRKLISEIVPSEVRRSLGVA